MPADASVSDVVVLGAGPAGLSAAVAAAAQGQRVVLVDAGQRPGGQYWRHRDGRDIGRRHGQRDFRRLRDAIAVAGPDRLLWLPRHAVWRVERADGGFAVRCLVDGDESVVRGRVLVVATGAYDRQLPFPGWTLPGVLAAGAVQALLRSQGVVAGRRIAVAGTGPFLLPVAADLVDAGATVVGVFEAGRPTAFLRHPVALLHSGAKLLEGAGYLRTLVAHRVPYRTRTGVVAALGTTSVTGVRVASLDASWHPRAGSARDIECDTLAVGYGFTPQTEIPIQLGCEMDVDADGSLVARADDQQQSTVPGVFVAGEVCGVGGALQAVVQGELAGRFAAARLGAPADPHAVARLTRRRAAHRAFAGALQDAFPVRPGWQAWLDDATAVCRCEEASLADLHHAVDDLGASDARSAKLLARPGMGPCQGRVCGYATSALVAGLVGRPVGRDDLYAMGSRPVAQPIRLGTLAGGSRRDS